MVEKVAESKKGSSNRRRFFSKLVGLATMVGIGGASLAGSTRKVYAANGDHLYIGQDNTGSSPTWFTAVVAGDAFHVQNYSPGDTTAIAGVARGSTGYTYGVWGDSGITLNGTGVYGVGTYSGVTGSSNSSGGVWGGVGVRALAGNGGSNPIIAKGGLNQSVNLQEWQDCWSTPLACVHANGSIATTNVFGFMNVQQTGSPYGVFMSAPADQCLGLHTNSVERVRIDSSGNVGIGTTTPNTPIHVESKSSNPAIKIINDTNHVGEFIYCYSDGNIPFFSGRRARGNIASPTAVQTDDVLMRYGGAGFGATGFPGGNRAILEFKAAQTCTDAAQGTYITFSTTPTGSNVASERMRITAAGEIIPPTDNTGSISTASKRWNLVRATTVTPGDLVFENGVRATEEGKGLAFLNDTGEKIAILDSEGNLRVKGKLIEGL